MCCRLQLVAMCLCKNMWKQLPYSWAAKQQCLCGAQSASVMNWNQDNVKTKRNCFYAYEKHGIEFPSSKGSSSSKTNETISATALAADLILCLILSHLLLILFALSHLERKMIWTEINEFFPINCLNAFYVHFDCNNTTTHLAKEYKICTFS